MCTSLWDLMRFIHPKGTKVLMELVYKIAKLLSTIFAKLWQSGEVLHDCIDLAWPGVLVVGGAGV